MGRLRGPGGSGGCERLSKYFRHQLKLASTKAITVRYKPGPASSIARNVQQSALIEMWRGENREMLCLLAVISLLCSNIRCMADSDEDFL
jgi:hypothetical protein